MKGQKVIYDENRFSQKLLNQDSKRDNSVTPCFTSRDASKHIKLYVDLEKSMSKVDFRSSSPGDPSWSWVDAPWRDKHFQTLAMRHLFSIKNYKQITLVTSYGLELPERGHWTLIALQSSKGTWEDIDTIRNRRDFECITLPQNGEVIQLTWP